MKIVSFVLPFGHSRVVCSGNLPGIVVRASGYAAVGLFCLLPAFRAWSADCVSPPAGLVAWWPGEGDALDLVGGNDGTLGGGVTFTNGEVGQAFSFGGGSFQVPQSDLWAFGTNSFTIELWANFNGGGGGELIGSYDYWLGPSWYGWSFEWVMSRDYSCLEFTIISTDGVPVGGVSVCNFYIRNQWCHLAFVRNGNVFTIFVNGVASESQTNSIAVPNVNAPLTIGGLFGQLDEVSIYNRALSATEIQSIYNAGSAGKCRVPCITTQPQSQTNNADATVTFHVIAGANPMGYQWQNNGTNLTDGGEISGSSTSTLTVSTITLNDAGNYTVVITNSYGSVTSYVGTLTVLAAPSITVPPQSQTVFAGSNVLFNVTVAAFPLVGYQWAFNGTNLTGGTGASLLLTNAQFRQSGSYSVAVSNSIGYAISAPATLSVLSPPQVLSQPSSQIGYWGKSVTLTVTAVGNSPLSYQWLKNATAIVGATGSSLFLTNLQMADAGNYLVVVTNAYGSTTSSNAYLTMNPAGVSLALYSGITIDGVVGLTYGIQYSTDLSNTNGWRGMANVTLSVPTELWFDVQPASQPQRYYRVVPGPISVP